jgi:hypothetical protein
MIPKLQISTLFLALLTLYYYNNIYSQQSKAHPPRCQGGWKGTSQERKGSRYYCW